MFGTNQHRPELPCSHTPSHRTPGQSSIQKLLCSPVSAGLRLAPGSKRFWGHHLPPGFACSISSSQTPRWRNSAGRRKQTLLKIVNLRWWIFFVYLEGSMSLYFKNRLKQQQQQVSQRSICNHHIKDEQSPLGSLQAADIRGLTLLSLAAAQILFFFM